MIIESLEYDYCRPFFLSPIRFGMLQVLTAVLEVERYAFQELLSVQKRYVEKDML